MFCKLWLQESPEFKKEKVFVSLFLILHMKVAERFPILGTNNFPFTPPLYLLTMAMQLLGITTSALSEI